MNHYIYNNIGSHPKLHISHTYINGVFQFIRKCVEEIILQSYAKYILNKIYQY